LDVANHVNKRAYACIGVIRLSRSAKAATEEVSDNDADIFSRVICDFANRHSLYRCDDLFPNEKRSTYYALKQESQIDYILCSKPDSITNYTVLDPDIN